MNLQEKIKITFLTVLFISTLTFVPSCDDIFVEDISDHVLLLQSPADKVSLSDSKIKFRWEAVPGASSYQMELSLPTNELVFDTVVTTNQCDTILVPGEYVWKVRALNSSYNTGFFSASFSIQSPFNISHEKLVLIAPSDQMITSENEIEFIWDAVKGAKLYRFKIKENSWGGDSIYGSDIYSTSCKFKLKDGTYSWGVAAIDEATQKRTDYSVRSISIDKNPPASPKLIFPANKDTLYDELINLKWNSVEPNASYSIEIYSDAQMQSSVVKEEKSDTSVFVNINKQGQYFWRVRAMDSQKNIGNFSPLSSFELQLPVILSDKQVKLSSPSKETISTDKETVFVWEPVSGANKYHLQVVSPSFKDQQRVAYDNLLDANTATMELKGGSYEWRVKALNKKSETGYTTSSFTVYDADLSLQKVDLLTPLHDAAVKHQEVSFSWQSVNRNTTYIIIIKKDNWENGAIVYQKNLSTTDIKLVLSHGNYIWGVKAIDGLNKTETEFSTRPLIVDLQKPEAPVLKAPNNNIITEEYLVEFRWEPAEVADASLSYTLEMYKVENNSDVQMTSKTTRQKNLNYNFTQSGKYKWRVFATDIAGNVSAESEYRFFEIKNITNLSGVHISLMSPADNLSTQQTDITFWWEEVSMAEKYIFQLVSPSFSSVERLVKSVEQTGNQIQISLTPGIYQWRVKAKNSSSETIYIQRSFVITN